MVRMWEQRAAVVIWTAALAARLVDCASTFIYRREARCNAALPSKTPVSCAGTYTVQSDDTRAVYASHYLQFVCPVVGHHVVYGITMLRSKLYNIVAMSIYIVPAFDKATFHRL